MTELIQGKQAVLEALKAGRAMNRIYIARGTKESIAEIKDLARSQGIPMETIERAYMTRMVHSEKHQGIMAAVAPVAYKNIEDLLDVAKAKEEPPFIVLLDGIEDPQNLGAILRTAEACGVHGVVIPKRRAAAVTDTVEKSSAGAASHVPIARVPNLNQTIDTLKDQGLWIVGLVPEGQETYVEVDLKGSIGIVIGAEGAGISHLTKQKCDFLVKIPMAGEIASLNASVSAALILYEVMKQRKPEAFSNK